MKARHLRAPYLAAAGMISASALVLSACGGGGAGAGSSGSAAAGGGKKDFTVVTSTNVYADIVSNVAGDKVRVVPLIDDPNKDPHDYEATSADQLKLSKADLVVENGGGYDSFVTTMLKAADAKPDVIDAVKVSGLPGSKDADNEDHDHDEAKDDGEGEFNEHVWYSIPTAHKVVDAVEKELSKKVPDDASTFESNAKKYTGQLDKLEDKMATIKKSHNGQKVGATEPVPLWLFESMGLKNSTPDDFLEAVEEGDDVPPLVLKKAKEQVDKKQVKLLAYNTQAANKQADQLKSAADKSGVPVVDISETMPAKSTYVKWMTENVDNISKALG